MHRLGVLGCLLGFTTACSGPDPSVAPLPPADSGTAPDTSADLVDAADTSAPVVPRPSPRQLVKLSGSVLQHPVVVPLMYADDAARTQTEALFANLPGSDYWKLLQEYGVGDVTLSPTVVIDAKAPASYTLDQVESTIVAAIDDGRAPQPDGSQIYAIIFPSQTKVLNPGGSPFCSAAGDAYHLSTVDQTIDFSYAIMPRCTTFQEFGIASTHELIEAATDPFVQKPAWVGTDPDHVGALWEVGDLCDFGGLPGAGGIAMFGARVERVFSNARAAMGIDPCAPDIALPYFDAAPVPPDDVSLFDPTIGSIHGRGVKVPVGTKKTVPLRLYSDRPLPPWTVTVDAYAEGDFTFNPSKSIAATLDSVTGSDGDVIQLTIERTTTATNGGDVVYVWSSNGTVHWFDTLYVAQ